MFLLPEFRRQFNKFCFLLNKYTEATIAELHSMLIHDLQHKFKAYINKFEKKKTQSKTDIDEDLPTVSVKYIQFKICLIIDSIRIARYFSSEKNRNIQPVWKN